MRNLRSPVRRSRRSSALLLTLALVALVGISAPWWLAEREEESTSRPVSFTAATDPLGDPDLSALAEVVSGMLRGTAATAPGSPLLSQPSGPVYVVLREGGVSRGAAWGEGRSLLDAVQVAVGQATRDGSDNKDPIAAVDTVEVAVSHSYRDVESVRRLPSEKGQIHRGILGVELTHGTTTTRYSPTWMLATNRSFADVLEKYAADVDVPEGELDYRVSARVFAADQILLSLADPSESVRMERGNTLVPIADITRESVAEFVDGLSSWMVDAVGDDGRLTYKYWPSRGEESTANNTIRQWMGTTALGRIAAYRGGDPTLYALERSNIDYNLSAFYREQDGLGLIVEAGTKVKLGAVGLAGRALLEHPDRGAYAAQSAALRGMVDHLWRPDGSFKTWYLPSAATGQENFYPGEALYFWSALYAESRDPALLERFMTSFEYYRAWHLTEKNRNPAFVPWHTQANYEVWKVTRDPQLAAFVFEMNDWLLGVQQWDPAGTPDVQGRFYDPDRPAFGPPHASATGVYLEGLADAYRLATELDDRERMESYRRAIIRGLRSVLQLQFADDIDMFYIGDRERVRGGVRTNVYDNEIRVDNVQHNLMAALKVLESFSPQDYRP